MKKQIAKNDELKLIGITTRTNNAKLFESDPETNPVASTVKKYFHNQLAEKIQHCKHPGKTFCVYTNYESDFTGNFTYLLVKKLFYLKTCQAALIN